MSLLPGLTEFNNHGIEVFNNDLYRVHRCFQDAVTRPVKNEDERKALIKAAFQFEERGLNRIADEFRAKHTHRLFPTAVGSLCAAVSRLAPPEIQPDAWILSADELALWDSYNLPACNLRLSPNQNYLSEVAPLAVFSPPAWTPEYRRSLDLAQRRSLSAKKARPPPSESSEVEIEAVPPIKKPRLSSSAKRTSTTEPETASEDGVDNAAEDDEEEDDSGESEVDELRSSPPPMTRPTRGRARGSGQGRGRGRVEVIILNWPHPKPLPKPAPSRRSTTIREDDERPSPSVPLTVEGRPTTRSTTAGSSKAPPASSKNTVSEKGKGRAVSISPPPAKKNIQRRRMDMESHDVKHLLAQSSVEVPYRFDVPRGEAFSLRDILESGRSMKAEMWISCLTCIIARVECNYVGRSDKCARCKTYRYLCDWILPQDEAFSQMDQVRAWGAPTPGHFHERMVELTRLLKTQDRLSVTICSLADTLSLTRKSIITSPKSPGEVTMIKSFLYTIFPSIMRLAIEQLYAMLAHYAYPANFIPPIGGPYFQDDNRIVLRIPLSTEREAELAIQLQFLVAIRHNGPYLQFILLFDPAQGRIYHGPLNNHRFHPTSRKVFNRLGNAMARVGFLKLKVASIPEPLKLGRMKLTSFFL
ncbi:hypothetical protein E1B28_006822 [Marasmius oreades]|uniref:Zn(2)-C6 fungal-type domain-containing protein n=1 Tax=Marasmius oreades TaxID=181124 RepID=A0A9P8AAW1_9AGAR|nr:uncharacterized protein E1B28_006822 [Marasmius oreades]KAG7096149.1 hypothetical protein E1B28_006822 [Marasmius oreades]